MITCRTFWIAAVASRRTPGFLTERAWLVTNGLGRYASERFLKESGYQGNGMKKARLRLTNEFAVVLGNRKSQAAEMVLGGGDKEGDSHNRHRGADQWLYVVSGTGIAIVNGKRYRMTPRSLLLIEHGDEHEIRQTGREPLRTVNIYVPPAYSANGDPLPRGRR